MSATASPCTVRTTRSPARTASTTWLVRLRKSRTPISVCDSVARFGRQAAAADPMKVKRCVDVLERRGPLRSAPRRRSQAASARSHRREPRGLADRLRCAAHRAREPAPARSSDRPGLRTGSERHLARPSGLAGHRVDASAVGLSQARERAARKGLALHLVQADLPSYTLPQAAFDLVVVANLHFAPKERGLFFSRAVSAVAPPGGVPLRQRPSPRLLRQGRTAVPRAPLHRGTAHRAARPARRRRSPPRAPSSRTIKFPDRRCRRVGERSQHHGRRAMTSTQEDAII
jgi:hypothetical protein